MDCTKGKNKEQLLDDIRGGSEPGSKAFEQIREAIKVECAKDIQEALSKVESSISKASDSSESLARKIFWLNVILVLATIVIAYSNWKMSVK